MKPKTKTNAQNGQAPDPLEPHNLEAEESVLGSILIDQDAILRVLQILEPRDFFMGRNGQIFSAMVDIHRARKPIDLVVLTDELERRGELENIGYDYLMGLSIDTPTSIHAEHYASIVLRTSLLRKLVDQAKLITQAAYAPDADPEQLAAVGRDKIGEIEKRFLASDREIFSLKDSLEYYLDLLQKREIDHDKPKLQFPWSDLGNLMPYLDAGTLVGLVADPGVGKTAFLENCAESWAKKGRRVAIFHFELSPQMMMDRRMQRATGMSIKRLQSGAKSAEDWDRINQALAEIEGWPGNVHYVHCPGWTMAQVVAYAQKLDSIHGLDVVIVDYLNKIRPVERNGLTPALSREADIENLKIMLETNGWVGLMAAQFDKVSRGQKNRSLADVKETSGLEDKANVGIVLRRDRDDEGNRESLTVVSVVKCNAGREGVINLYFKGERLLFAPVKTKEPQ